MLASEVACARLWRREADEHLRAEPLASRVALVHRPPRGHVHSHDRRRLRGWRQRREQLVEGRPRRALEGEAKGGVHRHVVRLRQRLLQQLLVRREGHPKHLQLLDQARVVLVLRPLRVAHRRLEAERGRVSAAAGGKRAGGRRAGGGARHVASPATLPARAFRTTPWRPLQCVRLTWYPKCMRCLAATSPSPPLFPGPQTRTT